MKGKASQPRAHALMTTAVFLLLLLLTANRLQAASPGGPSREAIYLKSRTLEPEPGLAPSLAQDFGLGIRHHGLIQLAEVPGTPQREALSQAGVTLLGYVPQKAWLASLPADLDAVRRLPFVRWIGTLAAEDKVDPALQGDAFNTWALNADGSIDVWIEPFSDVSLQEATAVVSEHGGTVTRTLTEYHRLQATLPATALWELAAEDTVQWIGEAPPPVQTLSDGSRALIQADAVQSNPYNLAGNEVQAGIWDLGIVDTTHPDFDGRLTVVETDAPTTSHATHVAGIMGGDGKNSVNYGGNESQWRGMAPGVDIFSFYWDSATTDHDSAINDYGIDLSQNSWALGGCSYAGRYTGYAADYDSIITGIYGRRIPVVFAAGNQRQACDDPYGTIHGGPQSAKNTITVGAVHSADSSMTSKSSWGPVDDGRLKPEVVAAGQTDVNSGIRSTVAGGGYGNYSGTSMSAPAVSGSIALLLEHYRSSCAYHGDDQGNPLPSTIKALLIHSAEDLNDPSTTYFNSGPDFSSGFGQIDDRRAAELVKNHLEDAVGDGEADTYQIQLTNEKTLKVTLVWDDVPGEANAARALVNDLDLELVAPDGTTVHGPWILDADNPQADAQRHTWTVGETGTRDITNVVEQVVVDAPAAGTWTVRVSGATVPAGPQSYSLVGEQLLDGNCQTIPTSVFMLRTDVEAGSRLSSVLITLLGFNLLGLATLFAGRLRITARIIKSDR